MQEIPYVGPYSPAVYSAANEFLNYGSSSATDPNILGSAYEALNKAGVSGYAPGATYGSSSLYDTQINNFQALKGSLDTQEKAAKGIVNDQYGNSKNNLVSARDQSYRTIDNAVEQNDANRVRSLRDLQQGIRGSMQGFNNQLGALGAGSSSAADVGGFAFAKLGAQGTTDINQSFGQNATQLGLRREDITSEFGRQLGNLDTWKSTQLTQIVSEYDALARDIQNQINMTSAEKAAAMSTINQQAIDTLNSLDQTYNNEVSTLNQQYEQIAQPQVPTSGLRVSNVTANPIQKFNPRLPQIQRGGIGGLQQAGGFSLQGSRRDDF